MSNNADVQEIKSRADIVAVISRYVKLKKTGRNYTGLCPFHGEKTPSFNVNPSLGIYKCFGCGVSGDVLKFVQEIEHLDFPQTLEKLAGELGVTLHTSDDPASKMVARLREAYAIVAKLYNYILKTLPQGRDALDYALNKRKLTEKTIEMYQIGYAPHDRTLIQNYLQKKGFTPEEIREAGFINEKGNDKFTDRLMFPIYDTGGHVVAFSGRVILKDDIRPKYLNSAESVLYKKRFLLFGLYHAKEAIDKSDMAILSEGQIDTISSQQAGVENIVAPLGTGLTENQLGLIARYTKNVAFCFDNDNAGQKSILRGVQLALAQEMNAFVITLPPDVKDIDELVQKRIDDWKDRAAHPQEFFTMQLAQLRSMMKSDLPNFERKLKEILGILGAAPELKQGIIAKQFAETLGLSEKGILAAIQKTAPPSFIRDEIKQKQGALSTAEYVLSVVLLFPCVALIMGKPETSAMYFPLKDQQEMFRLLYEFAKKHENLVKSVWDKKEKAITVSWESVYTRFTNEVAMEFSQWIAKISEENPDLATLVERIGLSEMASSIVVTDEVVADFFHAWARLKRQAIALRLEILRKQITSAEIAQDEPEIALLQDKIQENMELIKKIEKQLQ